MDKLNTQQQIAVDHIEGPLLILAGAGSGKTKVLTYKIARLLSEKYAKPEEILAVTFTNKAAAEMISRVQKLINPNAPFQSRNMAYLRRTFMPWMGTFHSICLRILKAHCELAGLSPNFVIYDTNDQADAMKGALKRLNLTDKKFNPKALLSQISSAKNEMIGPVKFEQLAQGYSQEIAAKAYPVYQKILIENSAVDFDDLLMKTVELLDNNPGILKKYQEQFKYILIDEYQDTNHAQYKLVLLLAEKRRNICVVGDDAQSIYSFRGANIQNILNFERDFQDATVVKLEQNYRSTKRILNAGNEIIAMNRNQKQKTLWTENEEGERISIYEAKDERDEAIWIAKKIKDMLDAGTDPNEIAVLYRTNAQSRAVEEGLLNYALKYRVVGGVKFYSRREIKDILSYLRVIFNPLDNLSLQRIINVPSRKIGEKKIALLNTRALQQGTSVMQYLLNIPREEESVLDKGILEFRNLMGSLIELSQDMDIVKLIKQVLKDSGYVQMLNDGSTENETRLENLKELLSVAQKYQALPPKEGLETFLNEVALVEQDDDDEDETAGRITLMTIHSAKGLEFKKVFLCGMEESLFPHSRSFEDPSEMEEERRLAYVAITRAKEKLLLSYAQSRVYFGAVNSNPVSRFLTDIPEDLTEIEDQFGVTLDSLEKDGWNRASDTGFDNGNDDWGDSPASFGFGKPAPKQENPRLVKGDVVRHPVFGQGLVVDLNDDTVVIDFAGGIRKELSLEYVQLTKVT